MKLNLLKTHLFSIITHFWDQIKHFPCNLVGALRTTERPERICCPWCWTSPPTQLLCTSCILNWMGRFSGNAFWLPKEYKAIFQIVCYLGRKWNLHAQKTNIVIDRCWPCHWFAAQMIHHRSYIILSMSLSWMDRTSPACRVKLIWSCMIRVWGRKGKHVAMLGFF